MYAVPSTKYDALRIVRTVDGYEVWHNAVLVVRCTSRLAALEELHYLQHMNDIEVDHVA